jgi:hypothetical protein
MTWIATRKSVRFLGSVLLLCAGCDPNPNGPSADPDAAGGTAVSEPASPPEHSGPIRNATGRAEARDMPVPNMKD